MQPTLGKYDENLEVMLTFGLTVMLGRWGNGPGAWGTSGGGNVQTAEQTGGRVGPGIDIWSPQQLISLPKTAEVWRRCLGVWQ